jgi:hypothetical protein
MTLPCNRHCFREFGMGVCSSSLNIGRCVTNPSAHFRPLRRKADTVMGFAADQFCEAPIGGRECQSL